MFNNERINLYIFILLSISFGITIGILFYTLSNKGNDLENNKIQYALNTTICFTPHDNCTREIVKSIDSAKKTIEVQAYQLTSSPIEEALIKAHQRGVHVLIILDKTQINKSAKFLSSYNIPIYIDYKPRIAHNKVMIIDNDAIITGSFNFTESAQKLNAENLIILENPYIANKYDENWQYRKYNSISYNEYEIIRQSK